MRRSTSEAATAVVHGMHPTRGYPVTWRITPVPGRRGRAEFLVEQADGMIEDDDAWYYAIKTVEVVTADEARELVGAVAPSGPAVRSA